MLDLRMYKGWKLQEIADKYKMTRERVRQIVGNTGDLSFNIAVIKKLDKREKDIRKAEKLLCMDFWDNVIMEHGKCWEWTGRLEAIGYGSVSISKKTAWFKMKGRKRTAHRVAYEITHGSIPEGAWVLHRCDNKRCVNPSHLYLGTGQDNVNDRETRSMKRTYIKAPKRKIQITSIDVNMREKIISMADECGLESMSRTVRNMIRFCLKYGGLFKAWLDSKENDAKI